MDRGLAAQVGPPHPALSFSPVGPAALGLPAIGLHAVAARGFLPEAGGPGVSPVLPSFPSLPYLGIYCPPVPHCPSFLWVPEQLLCLQSDIWDFYRPWLLGPTLPQLVRAGPGPRVGDEAEKAAPVGLPPKPASLFHSALGRCSWVWVSLPWMPCPRWSWASWRWPWVLQGSCYWLEACFCCWDPSGTQNISP